MADAGLFAVTTPTKEGLKAPRAGRATRQGLLNKRRTSEAEPEAVPLEEIGVETLEDEKVPTSVEKGYFHPANLTSGYFWGLIIIVIVAALIFFVLAAQSLRGGHFQNLNKPSLPSFSTLFVLWLAFFILFFVAAYLSYVDSPLRSERNIISITVIFSLIFLIIGTLFFFLSRNAQLAMFFFLLSFATIIFWIMLVWRVNSALFVILTLLVIWLVYNSWVLWEIFKRNDPSQPLTETLF